MKILAIDTSMTNCSVALVTDKMVLMRSDKKQRSHHQCILPFIDDVLCKAALEISDLDLLAYALGPGSFTGLRIGIGVIQGLMLTNPVAFIGISTLQAMAQTVWQPYQASSVVVINDAYMGEVYVGYYRVRQTSHSPTLIMQAVFDDQLVTIDDACKLVMRQKEALCIGTAWLSYEKQLREIFAKPESIITYPHLSAMLVLARYKYLAGQQSKVDMALPHYLRLDTAWQTKS